MPSSRLHHALFLALFLAHAPLVHAVGVFNAHTVEGEAVSLAEFFEPGKWTLVMIWTTYCAVCAEQFPAIEALHRKHHAHDLKVVGVALDGLAARSAVLAALERRQPTFDSLIGELDEVAESFQRATGEQFSGTPSYLLFNTSGELAARINGPLRINAIEDYIAGH